MQPFEVFSVNRLKKKLGLRWADSPRNFVLKEEDLLTQTEKTPEHHVPPLHVETDEGVFFLWVPEILPTAGLELRSAGRGLKPHLLASRAEARLPILMVEKIMAR